MDRKWVYVLGLITVAAIWGGNFAVSRLGMETFDPILFSFLRFGGAVPFFFLILKLKEGSIRIPWKVVFQLAGIGFVGITVLEIAVMYSIKYTTLANASLLNVAPWPIFAALFSPLFLRERITARLIVGGAIAMIGVSFIILGGQEGFSLASDNMVGNLLAFGISIIGALYNLALMPLMKKYSSLRLNAWMILFGACFMFPLTIGSWGKVDWVHLTSANYMAILYNVIVATIFAFVVWNASMFHIGAARANFFRYVCPAAAVLAGYVFYNEAISGWQLVGAGCMALGLVWISIERRIPKAQSIAAP